MSTVVATCLLRFYADLKESWINDAVDDSAASSQKSSLLSESAGTSTEVEKLAEGSASETEIASEWSELTTKKPQEASRATQVNFSQKKCYFMLLIVIF